MKSILEYSENVKRAGQILADADFVLIGAGAGLSAAAGLNYQDAHIFEELYPHSDYLTHWQQTVYE
jgi:NAD-dependent SIR2 family protein deacetylase